jgi:hypothetical protein
VRDRHVAQTHQTTAGFHDGFSYEVPVGYYRKAVSVKRSIWLDNFVGDGGSEDGVVRCLGCLDGHF